MSLRKRPSIIDDRFDSRDKGTFNDLPILSSQPTEQATRQYVPNITVPEGLEILSILLLDYQSKGIVVDTQEEALFRMWFPFAWHTIEIDDEIKNLSTSNVYKVEEIISDHPQYKRNYVVLRGVNPPKKWHILRMSNRRNDLVSIIPSFPDTESKPYEFTEQGHLQTSDTSTWTDVITYSVTTEQPGSLEGKMFRSGVQEVKPRFREEADGTRWFGQWIDTEVRFDFWTQMNATSERLREWFRDFSNKYRWLMEKNGLNRFMWAGSGVAEHVTRWRNDIVHRSSSYHLRTEYSYSSDLFRIRSTDLNVIVEGENNDEVITLTNNF